MVLTFNDTEEKAVEKIIAALADSIQPETIEPDSKAPTYIKTVLGIGYKFDPKKAEN